MANLSIKKLNLRRHNNILLKQFIEAQNFQGKLLVLSNCFKLRVGLDQILEINCSLKGVEALAQLAQRS